MSFDSPLPPYNASDPTAAFLNVSCFDLLLIELVPLAYRLVNDIDAGERTDPLASSPTRKTNNAVSVSGTAGTSVAQGTDRMDEEEEREAVFFRLEALGYRVGQGLVEKFSQNRPRFTDTLDVIKFLCKDLWTLMFRKQIDNLKTNHRGVYVLTDNSFRPFQRMSTEAGGNAVVRALPFLWFPCGLIRGALSAMGIQATVHAETSELPGATFQIKSAGSKP